MAFGGLIKLHYKQYGKCKVLMKHKIVAAFVMRRQEKGNWKIRECVNRRRTIHGVVCVRLLLRMHSSVTLLKRKTVTETVGDLCMCFTLLLNQYFVNIQNDFE